MGTTTLPFLDESKVPALILRSESSAGSSEMEKGCEAGDKISDPAPQTSPGPSSKTNTRQESVGASNTRSKDSSDSHTTRQPIEHAEQSPKCEKSSINVIEISDDDNDDGPANVSHASQDIIDLNQAPEEELPDALVGLDKNLERETWEFACAFSGHDPAKTDGSNPEHHHRFQGLRVAVKPHQLWVITRILFMYYFEKMFGMLLADGMGVGKTLEGSCGAILTPHIRLAAQQVRQDRKHRLGRHLPAGTSGNFLAAQTDILEKMSDADFESHKRSVIITRLEKLKNLDQETGRHWAQINYEYYDFESAQLDAAQVKQLTKSEMIDFYSTHVKPTSPARSKLVVQLVAQSISSKAKEAEEPSNGHGAGPNAERAGLQGKTAGDGERSADQGSE
ncbi:hypothetical protein F4677DRAFT_342702 [Hypoxylon crocopeplum]|nr:hypothetical protein F4677DRAFT_342702 [Hypoxylon crocopeplum]